MVTYRLLVDVDYSFKLAFVDLIPVCLSDIHVERENDHFIYDVSVDNEDEKALLEWANKMPSVKAYQLILMTD